MRSIFAALRTSSIGSPAARPSWTNGIVPSRNPSSPRTAALRARTRSCSSSSGGRYPRAGKPHSAWACAKISSGAPPADSPPRSWSRSWFPPARRRRPPGSTANGTIAARRPQGLPDRAREGPGAGDDDPGGRRRPGRGRRGGGQRPQDRAREPAPGRAPTSPTRSRGTGRLRRTGSTPGSTSRRSARARPGTWRAALLRKVIGALERDPSASALALWKGADEPWRYRTTVPSLRFAYCLATSRGDPALVRGEAPGRLGSPLGDGAAGARLGPGARALQPRHRRPRRQPLPRLARQPGSESARGRALDGHPRLGDAEPSGLDDARDLLALELRRARQLRAAEPARAALHGRTRRS